ncbi:hypothetical protein VVT58_19035 (plasmid) [Sphingobium sp. SJ10-10]|uniref:hypothetical protein n=1 Tax=Sphingobium sp. SJ10-10 TaxID=3114999 RepID=UPI002E192394|nr:hypothetical protein [Sphingobium sp. SJ10-10]
MIHPSAVQIVRAIETTLVDVVEPASGSIAARSALATIGHLLRHVALRIECEGQLLADDIAALRSLLGQLHDYLRSAGDEAQAIEVAKALERAAPDPGRYPSLALMAERTAILLQSVQDVLAYLQERRPERAEDSVYLAARALIRDYLAYQIKTEAALIHPAFEDKGPRR